MIVDCFLDTNVLVYAALGRPAERRKHDRARAVMAGTNFGLSSQVLQEFVVNATRKSDRPLTMDAALLWIDALADRPCVAVDRELVMEAGRLAGRFKISYWDSALVAAATRLGTGILYTEDLSHGQLYGSVRVVNPFLSA